MNLDTSVTTNPDSHHTPDGRRLRVPLQALATAQTKDALWNILGQYPDLLSSWADGILTQLVQVAWQRQQMDSLCIFIACRAFLARCRQIGSEDALAEQQTLPLPASSPLAKLLQLQEDDTSIPSQIPLYRRALNQVRRETERELWATLQYELANCLARSQEQDRAQKLEEALRRYQAVLEVWTRDDTPEKWAQVLHDMGSAFRLRVHGNRGENLKQAIRFYKLALQVLTRETRSEGWTATQMCLGIAWKDLPDGNRRENQERALKHYQAALKVWSRKANPVGWALVQHNLGNLCSQFVGGDRVTNLERALKHYKSALKIRTRDAHQIAWAMTQVAMANTYVERIRGDRAENLERAIELYQQALEERTRKTWPAEWAETQYDLAVAYRKRIRGGRAENQEKAIEHYRLALEVHTRQAFPEQWATAQTDLGLIYYRRLCGDRAENLEHAIELFKQALKVRKRDTLPEQWATTQLCLANAYCDRIQGDRAENLEQAIKHYNLALEVRTREAFPYEWAMIRNNLGTAYWERIKGRRAQNTKQAIRLFNEALKVHTPGAFPMDARRAARNLGNLYFEEEHWSQAHDAYATALRAAEILYRASYSPGGKEAELTENTTLYQRMVQTCLKEPDYAAALVHAEGGKARTFLDQMGQAAFPPPPDLPAALLQREEKAIEELRGQEQDLAVLSGQGAEADRGREPSREREIVEQRRETLAVLEAVWDEMAHDYPAARSYVALRRGEPVTWDNLCALAGRLGPKTALVEFHTLPEEIVVFVLRAGWEVPRVYRVPVGHPQLRRRVVNFFREVAEHPSYPTLNQTWQRLASPLLSDVLPHLKDARLVYLIPHGLLHYLPLHALEVEGAPLVEHFPVAYAPSAAVLGRVIEQAEERATNGSDSALVVGNPTGDLQFAESEAQIIAQYFGIRPYLRQEATKDRVVEKVKGRRNVHLACHGYFHPLEPLQSGIVLHDGVLTAQEILALRLQTELLVLSACQTAQQEVGRGDELMGLTRTLLYAGASSLVVSLWSVNDQSTGELMRCFYDALYQEGPSPRPNRAEVLRQAMLEIRRQPGWEHPYYWAPFILVGIV